LHEGYALALGLCARCVPGEAAPLAHGVAPFLPCANGVLGESAPSLGGWASVFVRHRGDEEGMAAAHSSISTRIARPATSATAASTAAAACGPAAAW